MSATPEGPLENFVLNHVTISALSVGSVADARNWKLWQIKLHTADGSELKFVDSEGIALFGNRGIAKVK